MPILTLNIAKLAFFTALAVSSCSNQNQTLNKKNSDMGSETGMSNTLGVGLPLSVLSSTIKEEWDAVCEKISSGELENSCSGDSSYNIRFECTLGEFHGTSALTACMAALSLKRTICNSGTDRSHLPSISAISCGIHAASPGSFNDSL